MLIQYTYSVNSPLSQHSQLTPSLSQHVPVTDISVILRKLIFSGQAGPTQCRHHRGSQAPAGARGGGGGGGILFGGGGDSGSYVATTNTTGGGGEEVGGPGPSVGSGRGSENHH